MALSEDQVEAFNRDGFLLIPDFWSREIVQSVRNEIDAVISTLNLSESRTVFSTTDNMEGMSRDRYFLDSGDMIRYYLN
jgi:phytanoyl-CoA hydroxylase